MAIDDRGKESMIVFRLKPVKKEAQSLKQPSIAPTISIARRPTRRTHAKSRDGCQQCKAERKKCDEKKPQCQRCVVKGCSCDYRQTASCLDGNVRPERLMDMMLSSVASLVDNGLRSASFSGDVSGTSTPLFATEDVLALEFFRDITCSTLGTPAVQRVYQAHLTSLAKTRPYLMHAILTTTHMHRRYVTESLHTSPAFAERNRLSLALSSYNARLAAPLTADDADALLATATLINAISFAAVSTTDPLASWPLVTSTNDLQWLAVQQGPGLVMANAGHWMAQSLFVSAFSDFERDSQPSSPNTGYVHPTQIPSAMFAVCGVTLGSIAEDNPYLTCLELLEPLLSLTPSTANMAKFLPFIGSIRPAFLSLLHQRDHSALLIFSWWYALLCPLEQWWLCTRARTECAAICIYLHQRVSKAVKELLAFPANACGLSMG